jgi:hypothetical protein
MVNKLIALIPLIALFISPSSITDGGNKTHQQNDTAAECEAVIAPLVNNSNQLEQLTNPILSSMNDVEEQIDLYSTILQCLDEEFVSQITGREILRAYLEYFLIFAGGINSQSEESTLELVQLTSSTDPGVVKIRDEAGIEAPDGYVFLRFYKSRERMPPLIRRAFESPDVAGVTILSRFIAVLAEEKKTWSQRALQQRTLPETISHELIHAYVNSILLPTEIDLPAWYSEGLAIYFSGSETMHTVITPNFSISSTSSSEYREYNITFQYLESELGRERLLELIRISIEVSDPSLLYKELGFNNSQELIDEARAWSQRRNNFGRAGILVLAFITVLVLWRLAPEYSCQNCGHTGKKRELINDIHCPNCLRPYRNATSK